MSYKDYQKSVSQAPPYSGPNGQKLVGEYGAAKDRIVERAIAATQARFPSKSPTDGLARIGADRLIDRSQFDTDQSFAAKLINAWKTWSFAGSAFAVLSALSDAGYDVPNKVWTFQQNGLAHTLTAALDDVRIVALEGDWRFDSNLDTLGNPFWNRFLVFWDVTPASWTSIVSPPTSVSAPNIAEVNNIRRLVRKWKATEALFVNITVRTGGQLWGWPDDTWGDGGLTWGGASSVIWSPIDQ